MEHIWSFPAPAFSSLYPLKFCDRPNAEKCNKNVISVDKYCFYLEILLTNPPRNKSYIGYSVVAHGG